MDTTASTDHVPGRPVDHFDVMAAKRHDHHTLVRALSEITRPVVALILDGARDQRRPQLCLFPEFLKSELREVRSTIEAHSQSAAAEDVDQGSANGLRIGDWLRKALSNVAVVGRG